MTAVRLPATLLVGHKSARRALLMRRSLGAAAIAWICCSTASRRCPTTMTCRSSGALNGIRDWVGDNRSILDPIRIGIAGLVAFFDNVIASLGWPGVIGLAGALGWLFGGWRLTILVTAGLRLARSPRPVGREHGDPRPDARRGRDRARHRPAARHPRRPEQPRSTRSSRRSST